VDLGEFVLGAGEADLESFGFAEPAFAVGFGDAGDEVVADLGDAVALGGDGGGGDRAVARVTDPGRCPGLSTSSGRTEPRSQMILSTGR
jgi:hypothetical protein